MQRSTASGRRSSYASVLSGSTAGPAMSAPRAGFLSGQLNDSSAPPASVSQSFPSQQPPPQPNTMPGARSQSDDPSMLLPGQTSNPNALAYGIDSSFPDFFVPSYLRASKHLERLQERHKHRAAAQRDGRSTRSSAAGSLSTSASGVNLHKMVPSHRGMTHEIIERPFRPNRDDLPLAELPSRWSATDRASGIEVASDGSEVKFNGSTKATDEGAAARADRPIPKECGVYYFEVDILSKNKESQIALGFSGSVVVLNRMPGWELNSWAYHGDDGHSFCQSANGKAYGHKFGSTDSVGCGINFRNNSVFFTKNGVHLGTAFRDLSTDEPLYPAIGFKRANEQVRVNFGQSPFVFDIDGMVEAERESIQREIHREDASALDKSYPEPALLQELVAQYLAHDGYIETAKAFTSEVRSLAKHAGQATDNLKITGMLEYKEDQDAIHRQRIRGAILEGDVDRALKLTNTFYPSVLQDNENIYFKLRCRKFIEMIRSSNELQQPSSKSRKSSKAAATNGHSILAVDDAGVFGGQMELDDEVAVDDGMDIEAADDPALTAKHTALMDEALAYGRELQSEFKDDPRREVKQALEDTFALIAYSDARESSLAPLLETGGRVPVAEELNSAILVSLGKSSSAVVERLYQQAEVLVSDLTQKGTDGAALINPRAAYMQ